VPDGSASAAAIFVAAEAEEAPAASTATTPAETGDAGHGSGVAFASDEATAAASAPTTAGSGASEAPAVMSSGEAEVRDAGPLTPQAVIAPAPVFEHSPQQHDAPVSGMLEAPGPAVGAHEVDVAHAGALARSAAEPAGREPATAQPIGPASAEDDGAPALPAAAVDDADTEPPAPLSRRERFRAWRFAPVVEIVATVALALVLAESVQAAVVKPFVIPSGSMEPTLLPGQRVLVNRLAYDFGGTPQRGDIVVFHPPSSLTCKINVPLTEPCPVSLTTHAGDYFVKRVIGLPGDTLSIRNGHPVINGRELTHEPYITACSDSTSCNMPHTIVIPRDEYYMLGDNRGDSDDSRYWGPVPLSWIIGEVFATYWPLDRIGVF
jgi:signal peptidase I